MEIPYEDNLHPEATGIVANGRFYPRSIVSYLSAEAADSDPYYSRMSVCDHGARLSGGRVYLVYASIGGRYSGDPLERRGDLLERVIPAELAETQFMVPSLDIPLD